MKTEWDYTILADAYLKRPDYSSPAIDAMLAISGIPENGKVCDVGAGVAHLTLMFANLAFEVTAVEPNDAMRNNGIKRTLPFENVTWKEGSGEDTGLPENTFDLVSFGSSFNVCDRTRALKESSRILKPQGWFACMWNHRRLDDPIQERIELIINEYLPSYGYGLRREDQEQIIENSGLFGTVVQVSAKVVHTQTIAECVEAWRSHATLQRQAASKFTTIVDSIHEFLVSLNTQSIDVPYDTRIWLAQHLK